MNLPEYDKSWWMARSVVIESGCWEWAGATKGNGYGNIKVGAKNYPAHRLAMMQMVGAELVGLDVCHQCDNRLCVNPDHLFVATRKLNMVDAKNKGRSARAERLPQTKVSESQKQEILEKARQGIPYKVIAEQYSISKHRAGQIAIENGIRRKL